RARRAGAWRPARVATTRWCCCRRSSTGHGSPSWSPTASRARSAAAGWWRGSATANVGSRNCCAARPGHRGSSRRSPERIALGARRGWEGLLEAWREHTWGTVPDAPAVHLDDGHDLGAGSGEEALRRGVQIEARQAPLARLDARLGGEREDGTARDALQRAVLRRRREQRTAADEEEVVCRAL